MKKILFLATFLIVTQTLFAQGKFQMRYGSPYYDRARKVIQTQDGNFVIVGQTNGFGSGGNALIMKVDGVGTILWSKDYSGINADVIIDIIELSDNKLVMCGETNSYGAGLSDGFVMKTDPLGNIVWARTYGNIGYEQFLKITVDEADGFYVAGYTYDFVNTSSTIIKLDALGNILWNKAVNDASNGSSGDVIQGVDIVQIASGGVILAEHTITNTSFSLYKFSALGNLIWSNKYLPTPVGSGLSGLSILEKSNSEILINFALANQNTVAQSADNFIITLSSSGILISDKSYGGTYGEDALTISNTTDGGIIICGVTNSAGNGGNDDCLIRLFPNGSIKWAKAYGTAWGEFSSNALQTADGGFILTGQTWPVGFDNDSSKLYLVKMDSLGNSDCNDISWSPIVTNQTLSIGAALAPVNVLYQENIINWNLNNRHFYSRDICDSIVGISISEKTNKWNIYPNPFSTSATIETETQITSATIEIFNIFGEQVKTFQLSDSKSKITRDNLSDGVYFYQIVSNNKVVDRGKLIIE
jgi:hypothetical protein